MRILMLTSHYVDQTHGGVESHVLYLSEALTALGHDVLVARTSSGASRNLVPFPPAFLHLAPSKAEAAMETASARIPHQIAGEFLGRLLTNVAVRRRSQKVTEFRPQIVHHHDFLQNLRLARSVARRAGARRVWTNHLGETLILNRSRLGQRVLRRLARDFDLVFAPSVELLEASGDHPRRQYAANGVDTTRFVPLSRPERDALRASRGLQDKFVVVVPRRWAPTKGVAYFAEALVGAELPDVHVLFVGAHTPGYEDYQRNITQSLDKWNVPFEVVPSVSPTEMPAYYQLADLAVFPSVLEATSLGVLEAMASGCLVLATRVGGIPEIVTDGETGLLCEPQSPDALHAGLLAAIDLEDGRRRTLMERARDLVETRFSWNVVARQFEESYAQLLEEGQR